MMCALKINEVSMTLFRTIIALMLLTMFSSCAIIEPYHIQIQQGMKLTSKQIEQVKPGMSKSQVQYILGTPNVVDPYHPNAWYYVYTNELSGRPRTEKKLMVTFDQEEKVVSIGGDFPPPSDLKYTTVNESSPSTGADTRSEKASPSAS